MTPTIAMMAKKVIIELSSFYHTSFRGFHDNYVPLDPRAAARYPSIPRRTASAAPS